MSMLTRLTLVLAFALAAANGTVFAQSTHSATGVVKKVDAAKSTVTLAHDPVRSLNWPAMTMGFTVKEKALLDKLQPGKKIEFEFVQQGKNYVITSVK